MAAFKYLLEKELKQLLANTFLLRIVIAFPIVVMLVFPWIATLDIKNVNLTIVDNDNSSLSKKLIGNISSSSYFSVRPAAQTYDAAMKDVERGGSDLIMVIPEDFESDLTGGVRTQVFIAANAVNSTKSSLGSGYLGRIIQDFALDNLVSRGFELSAPVDVEVKYQYNPTLDYRKFMAPAMTIIILILVCGILPALSIVGEKEKGTIEQINVTPVSKLEFILSKNLFFWILGLGVFTIAFFTAALVYGMPSYANVGAIYVAAGLFILIMSAVGLIVSNFASTMQQAIFVMFFFVVFMMLMCGLFTPIESMPMWSQYLTYVVPPRYFVNIVRSAFLKGSSFADLSFDFMMLAAFAFVFNAAAVLTYRKRGI